MLISATKNFLKYIEKNDYLKILVFFLVFFFIFSCVYFTLDKFASHDDHFFHIRFAEIIKEKGLEAFKDFKWIYFSDIAQNQKYFVYYNFLFYLALIPFTFITPLFLGIKLYAVFFIALSFSVVYFFFLKIKEKNALWLTLAIFSFINYSAIWRLMLSRPYVFAPPLLLLLIYFLHKKYYWAALFISVFYFYWHTATFFFPVGVAVVYFLFESFYEKKSSIKVILFPLLGVMFSFIASLFFAPGLMEYMKTIIVGIFTETVLGNKVNIAEGSEVYPMDFFDFAKENSILLMLIIVSVFFEILRYIKEKKTEGKDDFNEDYEKRKLRGTMFFLGLVFFAGSFLSKRNADFFIYFMGVYLALNVNFLISFIKIEKDLLVRALKKGIILIISIFFILNILFVYENISSAGSYSEIAEASDWIKENVEHGKIIFNPTWNWFPLLFYYNPENYYIVGLEPRFLYTYDSNLYWLWWNISSKGLVCNQEYCDNIEAEKKQYFINEKNDEKKQIWYNKEGDRMAGVIKKYFQSEYIITSTSFGELNAILNNNDNFEKVFESNVHKEFLVYHIK